MPLRRALGSLFAFVPFLFLFPGSAVARDTYFSPNCGSCHTTTMPTCNGCHVHGTHPDYLPNAVGTLNLKASVDKTTYVEGDPIVVTLEGGHMADFKGWVGARVYDASGTEVTRKQAQLGCAPYPTQFGNKCDLPMKLSVPAKLGWTRLYMSWAGNQYDRTGATFGAQLGTTFGAGRRALTDAGGNQVTNHVEEIVATGTFTVTPAPPMPTPAPQPTPEPNPDTPPDDGSGGGQTGTDPGGTGTDTGTGSGGSSSGGDSGSQQGATGQKSAAAGALDVWIIVALIVAAFIFATRFVSPRRE
jgi:hypothetical protein